MNAIFQPNGLYAWLLASIFWIGVLLLPIALALIIMPIRTMRFSHKLNRWISTKQVFEKINRPRYQERFIYRHHRFFGGVIVLLSLLCIYMLFFYAGPNETLAYFSRLVETEFGVWLVSNGYYLLLILNVLALITGVVVFIRPSLLKSLERWSNRWIETDRTLERLDRVHEIPANILPGKPRVFGVFVLIGACYMIYTTAEVLF